MPEIAVLSVVSELYPLVKTGGLADVSGALPGALAAVGVRMVSLIPGYPAVMAALESAEEVHTFPDLFGGRARLLHAHAAGLELLVIDAPHLYDRPGSPYLAPGGVDWPDNAIRFAALSAVGAYVGAGHLGAFQPHVVHAHDWQAGLTAAYIYYGGAADRVATVMTVHNLAFQGKFPAEILPSIGLPPHAFSLGGVEFYGSVGYLKAGLLLSDRITTVSPTYALEITTPDGGMGLDGLLRAKANALVGIVNGIDTSVWNPATDPLIEASFDAKSMKGRAINKAVLQRAFGIDVDPSRPLFGLVSRLSWQKGPDLLLESASALIAAGGQLVVLGSGDHTFENAFRGLVAAHPDRIGVVVGYDEALAHRVQAGSDVILVPSRFEPCGLTQLCALRYGALPLVARVGGLADTVIDANEAALAAGVATGFQFAPTTADMLQRALARVAALWDDRERWGRMQKNAMTMDVSWAGPAARYAALYREVLAERR
ncbi:glycogen synthase GlgA [Segnochrobactrum spirostomi]|uniref:Glycogen synthase n=1 Tax=Segnochrobactrum spirostomi TaxID=2608987 RepID=A0A6A7Y054_9HYPH|nr:glycogen synthase GlgA [Segnochrobactrum spirostomi]MQT11767.1 glycogen synthase GlgA [Segnochrobactrum spirostomi]